MFLPQWPGPSIIATGNPCWPQCLAYKSLTSVLHCPPGAPSWAANWSYTALTFHWPVSTASTSRAKAGPCSR